MIILDTSVLYAFFVAKDPAHELVQDIFRDEAQVCIVSPYVVAELDYFVLSRFGVQAELEMLRELAEGPYEIAEFTPTHLVACRELLSAYSDIPLGITDASLAVLASVHDTSVIATLDRRHFRALRMPDGRSFTLLP